MNRWSGARLAGHPLWSEGKDMVEWAHPNEARRFSTCSGSDGCRGEPCCDSVVYPEVERQHALRLAEVAKALGDPIRLQLVDVLRKHAGKVCVCGLVPLFDVSQPTLSHHLRKLRAAGLVDCERDGVCAYYYVTPAALDRLAGWLD